MCELVSTPFFASGTTDIGRKRSNVLPDLWVSKRLYDSIVDNTHFAGYNPGSVPTVSAYHFPSLWVPETMVHLLMRRAYFFWGGRTRKPRSF